MYCTCMGSQRSHHCFHRGHHCAQRSSLSPHKKYSASLAEAVLITKHDEVIKWQHFPSYRPFVMSHWSLLNSSHKGQWRGALMFSLICAWINASINNREAGDLRCHHAHYDVIVMDTIFSSKFLHLLAILNVSTGPMNLFKMAIEILRGSLHINGTQTGLSLALEWCSIRVMVVHITGNSIVCETAYPV